MEVEARLSSLSLKAIFQVSNILVKNVSHSYYKLFVELFIYFFIFCTYFKLSTLTDALNLKWLISSRFQHHNSFEWKAKLFAISKYILQICLFARTTDHMAVKHSHTYSYANHEHSGYVSWVLSEMSPVLLFYFSINVNLLECFLPKYINIYIYLNSEPIVLYFTRGYEPLQIKMKLVFINIESSYHRNFPNDCISSIRWVDMMLFLCLSDRNANIFMIL